MSCAVISSNKDYITYLSIEKEIFNENYGKKFTYDVTPDDFQNIVLLGCGSFGKVYLVQKKDSTEFYAMKVLDKHFLVKTAQIQHTLYEKQAMECLRSSFTVNLLYSFKSNSYIYFVLPFIPGGEIFNLLRLNQYFTEEQTKFYTAQVVLGLEYLHNLKLVYRDLKPENLLIDCDGYLKISDFGFCKIVEERTYTFCGTPDYIAPEVILNKGHGKAVDFWSLGVLIYEMCAGFPPFIAPDVMGLFETITVGKYRESPYFTRELKDIIKKLLKTQSTKRIGNLTNGINDIKNHNWFKGIDWLSVLNHQVKPHFIPHLNGPDDTQYFDPMNNSKKIHDSVTDHFPEEFSSF